MNTVQRELKFRAFDNRPDAAYFGQMVENPDIAECIRLGIPVMQYTGLKDKNNQDVFEGDVVRCTSGCPHVVEWRHEIGGEFGGGMPGWYLSGLATGYGKGYAWIGIEAVIGNIHQNPELLEV